MTEKDKVPVPVPVPVPVVYPVINKFKSFRLVRGSAAEGAAVINAWLEELSIGKDKVVVLPPVVTFLPGASGVPTEILYTFLYTTQKVG